MAEATLIARIRASVKDGVAGLRRFKNELKGVGAAGRKARAGVRAAGQGVDKLTNKLRGAGGVLGRFRVKLLDAFLIRGIIDAFISDITRIARAFAGLVTSTAKTKIELDAADIKLRAGTESALEFAQATFFLNEQVDRLGLELVSTKSGLADFLASTRISNLSLEERLDIFRSLTDAARVFSLSQERVKLAFLAVGQIASKGALAMEEVRRQLGDQIPGVIPLLAEKLGITIPKLFDLVRAKAISAEEGLRALRDGLDDLVGDQVEEAAKKLVASLGRMQTAIVRSEKAFAEGAEGGLKVYVEALKDAFVVNKQAATSYGELAGSFIEAQTPLVGFAGDLATLNSEWLKGAVGSQTLQGTLGPLVEAFKGLRIVARLAANAIREQKDVTEEAAETARLKAEIAKKAASDEIIVQEQLARATKEIQRDIVAGAEETARERLRIEKELQKTLTDTERALVDEKLQLLEDGLEGVQLSGEKRQKIEGELTDKLLDVERKFQRDIEKLREDAREKVAKDKDDAVEIEEELADKILNLLRKRQEAFDKLVENRIDKSKKAADAEIKEIKRVAKEREKDAKDQIEAAKDLAEALKDIREGDQKVSVGVDDSGLAGAGGRLAELQAELAKLSVPGGFLNPEDINRLGELPGLIQAARVEMLLLGGAATTSRDAIGDLVKVSEENLKALLAQLDSEEFKKAFADMTDAGKRSFEDLRRVMIQTAEAANLNADRAQAFGFTIANALINAAQKGRELNEQLKPIGEQLKDLSETVSEQTGLKEFGDQAQEAEGKIVKLEKAGEDGRTLFTNYGEAAEKAAKGVDEAGGATERFKEIVEEISSGGDGVKLFQMLAELGREASTAASPVKEVADNLETFEKIIAEINSGGDGVRLFELMAELGATATDTAPKIEPLTTAVESLKEETTVVDTTLVSINESLTTLAPQLTGILTALDVAIKSEAFSKTSTSIQEISDALDTAAPNLELAATSTEKFVEFADKSGPAGEKLRTALEKIGAKEIAAGLRAVQEVVQELAEGLEQAADGGSLLEAVIDRLVTKAENLKTKFEELTTFVTETVIPALDEMGVRVDTLITKFGELETAIKRIEEAFQRLRDKANMVFDAIDARIDGAIGRLQQVLELLNEVDRRSADVL